MPVQDKWANGRLIGPEEIANIALFLASAHSMPLQGAVIDASMGLGPDLFPGDLINDSGNSDRGTIAGAA